MSVAAAYSLLVGRHVVFDLFFSLTLVCVVRGGWLYAQSLLARRAAVPAVVPAAAGGEPNA
jgi:hypothetical protein